MRFNPEDQKFIESLATTGTGRRLMKLLGNLEIHYADIRNLDVDAKVRIDALKILREALLDKLIVLSGKKETPVENEYQ